MNAVVNGLKDHWHKLLASLMQQQGINRITVTAKDLEAIQNWVVVVNSQGGVLEILLFDSAEKANQYSELVRSTEGGRA